MFDDRQALVAWLEAYGFRSANPSDAHTPFTLTGEETAFSVYAHHHRRVGACLHVTKGNHEFAARFGVQPSDAACTASVGQGRAHAWHSEALRTLQRALENN